MSNLNNKITENIVISSRIRLARNVEGIPFQSKLYDIDLAKIDRSIVSNLDQETGVKLLESIIQLATKFNMRILCEGVETEEQLKIITDNGCDFGQGYYFYKPAPREEIEEILQKENT